MVSVSRDDLHRAVEQLPDDRLTAAAELLDALALHDQRVANWHRTLTSVDVSDIAGSLRRQNAADEWIADEVVAAWLDSPTGDESPPASRHSSQ
jgi:hypothetical protein